MKHDCIYYVASFRFTILASISVPSASFHTPSLTLSEAMPSARFVPVTLGLWGLEPAPLSGVCAALELAVGESVFRPVNISLKLLPEPDFEPAPRLAGSRPCCAMSFSASSKTRSRISTSCCNRSFASVLCFCRAFRWFVQSQVFR